MTNMQLSLFCLVDGESTPFPVEIESTKTIGDLKKAIKDDNAIAFADVDAKMLTLWRVSIPVLPKKERKNISLVNVPSKEELDETDDVSDVFKETPPKKTIHIIVQRPSQSRSGLSVVVKPEKKVAFTWSTFVDVATLDDFRCYIFEYYPQYAHDEYLEIFVYNGHPKPERVSSDGDLCKILKIAKTTSMTKLTVSLETPTKNFSAWTFKDVCDEYNLSESSDPDLEVIPPFTDVEAVVLDSDFEKKTVAQLEDEVGTFVDILNMHGTNKVTKLLIVSVFLAKVTRLFKEDLYLAAQRNLSGHRGNGPVDLSVHSQKNYEYTLGMMEVKKDDFVQGVAQNIVQLESAMMEKKRKHGLNDVDEEEEQPM
ncbi:hypothetical protein BG006_002104, partial [Podila minutissima]